LIYREGGTKT